MNLECFSFIPQNEVSETAYFFFRILRPHPDQFLY